MRANAWRMVEDLRRDYERQRTQEVRVGDAIAAKVTGRFVYGQPVSHTVKNPKGGMFGRIAADDLGHDKVTVMNSSGGLKSVLRKYLVPYISTKTH